MEKKPVKIVTIGGGSSYTPELMEGFIKRTPRGRMVTELAYRHFGRNPYTGGLLQPGLFDE